MRDYRLETAEKRAAAEAAATVNVYETYLPGSSC